MLFVGLLEDGLIIQQVLDLGKQVELLIIVVGLDKFEPSQGIAHKIGLVGIAYMRSLQIYAVVAAKDGVVK